MWKWKNKGLRVEQLDTAVDITNCCSIQAAKLIYVEGKGVLKEKMVYAKNSAEHNVERQLCLNDIPLVQYNSHSCPTCANWVATGYGIQQVVSSEWIKTIQKMNKPFCSVEDSIERLDPILKLLESGLYLIADVVSYPTNGAEQFFWAAANKMSLNLATRQWFCSDRRGEYLAPEPVYLYPSQSVSCYNPQRVEYYVQQFKRTNTLPHAVTYNFCQGLSVILDGHHKACAAALLGVPINCVVIIPYQGRLKEKCFFSDVQIDASQIPQEYLPQQKKLFETKKLNDAAGRLGIRNWETEYQDSVRHYPNTEVYAEMKLANIKWGCISDAEIEQALADDTFDGQCKTESILYILYYKKDPRLKEAAMRYAKERGEKMAYELLSRIKNDPDVEQLFIDYLVNSEDKTDPVLGVIHGYWD